ncbi:cell adhesion molecule CEACAM6-like [Lycodopsis pacificus]
MEIAVIHFIILVAISGLTKAADVLPDGPLNAAVGETVMFTTTLTPPETPFLLMFWKFGANNIITFNTINVTAPEYEGRITLFMSTGSLELRNLTRDDSGEYSVSIFRAGALPVDGTTRLDVHALRYSGNLSRVYPAFAQCLCYGEGLLPDSLIAAVGGKVTFTTTVTPPATPFLSVSWSFTDIHSTSNIITSSDEEITGPPYTDRITFFRSSGSLELWNLTDSDSGEYSIFIIANGAAMQNGKCRLVIQAPVSNAVVTISSTDMVEFSSVSLSCSASSGSFLWLNSSSEVKESESVQLTDGGGTLTIINVTRYDRGPFRCSVSNGATIETSQPVNLFIQFGPDNTAIKAPKTVRVGDFTMLYCSTMSVPAPTFSWLYDGKPTSMQESVYIIPSIRSFDGGTYTCTAVNAATGLNQTVSHKLTVADFSNCDCSVAAGRATIITFGCLLIIAIACGTIVYCKTRRNR